MNNSSKASTTTELAALFRELAGLYVGHADELQVRVQEATDGNSAYFIVSGRPEDDSRLVGSSGCHVNSFRFLIEQVGLARGMSFTSRLLTTPGSSAPWYPPKDALDYDPRHVRDVLARVLEALGVEKFSVAANAGTGPRNSLSFNFEIKIEDGLVAEGLTLKREFLLKEGRNGEPDRIVELSIVEALGTLMRAVAKQSGVRFQVRLADRVGPAA